MKKPLVRALQGVGLSLGAPLGWMALQWLGGHHHSAELPQRPGVYVYMFVGSALAFIGFGWYSGTQEERHRETSLHDALTGLYNSRYFWGRLEDECSFAQRHGRPLALLIGDLDFFKRVNDTWGHQAGDHVLASVAAALMRGRRRGDTIARVGGEEFAVILPETGPVEAAQVAERLRAAVAAQRFSFERPEVRDFVVTMSFGVAAAAPERKLSAAQMFERADRAMYRAKQGGRDRVMAAEET
jgi:diguanylate cyclase (GGDEF)-like protein